MAFIDGTVVNVALPALQKNLNANLVDVQWVVESYLLFISALLLVGGAAGDRFGRRRMFAIGTSVFAAASAWCGFAGGINELVIARSVQGIGSALLVPGSLALISASFDEGSRGEAIGTWSGATAITTALGPVLGGYLVEHLSWRAAFLVNVPIAAIVLVVTLTRVPESRDERTGGDVDWQGAALATVGLGGLVYGLLESSNKGWAHPAVVIAIASGTAALAAFFAVERRHAAPMMPLELFRSSDFLGANILTLLLYATLAGGLFYLPLNLMQVQGYTATQAGAAALPMIVMMFLLSRWAGGLVVRYGGTKPLMIGAAITAVAYVLFALPGIGASYWVAVFPGMTVLGLGMAITVAPLTTVVMNSVECSSVGVASGINNAASRVAGLFTIALFGIVLAGVFNHSLNQRLQSASLPPNALASVNAQRDKLAAIELPEGHDRRSTVAARRAIDESFVLGFRWLMIICALLAAVSAVSAPILLNRRGRGRSG